MRFTVCGSLAASLLVLTALAEAQTPTRINVRVVSHDAKIIGSGVGGARIIVRDPATGQVLAEEKQEGDTGDTQAIVVRPMVRGESVYATPGAAMVTLTLDLDRPRVLEFVGEGPLGYEHAVQRAVKQMLVVPGEDILGDGVVLELHGFIVELLEPAAPPAAGSESVQVLARVLRGGGKHVQWLRALGGRVEREPVGSGRERSRSCEFWDQRASSGSLIPNWRLLSTGGCF
jgi:hypothetical protein